jgi:hypothetical protein
LLENNGKLNLELKISHSDFPSKFNVQDI